MARVDIASGAVLTACGLLTLSFACASFLVLLLGLVYRLLSEEHAMINSMGDAYLDFANDWARLFATCEPADDEKG